MPPDLISHRHFLRAAGVTLAALWLTVAQRAGVKCERFADSTGMLAM